MSRYFALKEFLVSREHPEIDNTPSFEVVENLKELSTALDGLREAWGGAINVTSGYRCPELNKAARGVSTSAHLTGRAADIVPANGRIGDFEKFCVAWVAKSGIRFDQLIRESVGGKRWVHFGIRNNSGHQRMQILNIDK